MSCRIIYTKDIKLSHDRTSQLSTVSCKLCIKHINLNTSAWRRQETSHKTTFLKDTKFGEQTVFIIGFAPVYIQVTY